MTKDNYDPSKKYSNIVRYGDEKGDIFAEIDEMGMVLKGDDQALLTKYGDMDPDKIRKRFMKRWKWRSAREVEKLNLLIQYINNLVEFERSKSRYAGVELEKRIDQATQVTQYKELEVKYAALKLEFVKIRKALAALERGDDTKREDFDL
jgi:hypothetical protein